MIKELFSNRRTVSIDPTSIFLTLFILLTLYFLYYIKGILLMVLMAFIIMVGLHPLSHLLYKRFKLPKVFSIIMTYVIFLTVVGTFLAFILPPLASELYQLLRIIELPVLNEQIRNFNFTLQEISAIADKVGSSVNFVYQIINTTFSSIFTLFTLLVISFYMMLERDDLYKKVYWFSRDPAHLKTAKEFIDSVERQLGGWVRGQLILMFVVGAMTYVGLTLLSIPHALPLAILAGLLEIIPNIGPTISAIPAIFIAYLTFGPLMAAVTLLLYIVTQQLENNFLVPKVLGANANVNPLTAILAIIIGLKVAGVVGALLSIPIYIVIRTVYSTFFYPKAPVAK